MTTPKTPRFAGESSDQVSYDVGHLRIEPGLDRVTNDGQPAHLPPMLMDILVHLIERAPNVVATQDLLDRFWAGKFVEASSVHRCISRLRRALGDDPRNPQHIVTVPKRGYQWVAEVRRTVSESRPTLARNEPPFALPASETTEPMQASEMPFVGRVALMQRLTDCLQHADSGSGRVVLLTGEPGIGKTRTAEEFAARAKRNGALVYAGWCDELGLGVPFWPWVGILRAIADEHGIDALCAGVPADAALLSNLLPELRQQRADLPPPQLEVHALHLKLAEAILGVLRRLGVAQPVLICLDDVHHGDAASLAILRLLARHIARERVMLLGTYRDAAVQRAHLFAEALNALTREAHCERHELAGLPQEDINALVANLEPFGAGDDFGAMVGKRTDGNPLYATLLIQAQAEGDAAGAEIPHATARGDRWPFGGTVGGVRRRAQHRVRDWPTLFDGPNRCR